MSSYLRLTLTNATPAQVALVGALAVKLTADHPDDDVRYGGHVLEWSHSGEELLCEASMLVAGEAAAQEALAGWRALLDDLQSKTSLPNDGCHADD